LARTQQIPNWQLKFKSLPEIPESKQWQNGLNSTIEQTILIKLLQGVLLNESECYILLELTNFYSELDENLKNLNYKEFTTSDITNFKNYILYAFNYIAIITNDFKVLATYRLVVNESVLKKDQRITNVACLKNPNLNIVKEIGKFNRGNTTETTMFYSAENIDTALKEIRPPLNKLITVGIWTQKHGSSVNSYPIFDSSNVQERNEGAKKANFNTEKQFANKPPLLAEFMRRYFKLLAREYSKSVTHHYEYIISALFTEQLLKNKNALNDSYDFIVYPSVGNNHVTDNIVMPPEILSEKFKLVKVIEFVIEEANYDKEVSFDQRITLAKVKNLITTTDVRDNGDIVWPN
jgi:hypothetical protein